MQVVGDLVGVGADERALHLVDGAIEGLHGDRLERLRECPLELGIEELPEGAAATHDVLPQARLALMDARRRAMPERRSLQVGADPLLVDAVAGLVERAEQGVGHIVVAHPRGDAHVAQRELGHERVVGLVLPPALEVVAELLDHPEPEGELRPLGRAMMEARIVHRRLRRDGVHQRDQPSAQLGEDSPQRRGLHPVVRVVDQRVGDALVSREEAREAAAQVQRLLEERAHPGEIVRRPGLRPGLVRDRRVVVEVRDERPRDLHGLVVFAARGAHQRGLVGVVREAGGLGPELVEQPADRGVGESLVRDPAQHGELPPARRGAAGGHVGRLIPAQHGRGHVEVVNLHQSALEFCELAIHVVLVVRVKGRESRAACEAPI